MELGAVENIGAVKRIELWRSPTDLAPAVGVERTERMEDDSYERNAREQDRGMEEDGEEEQGESDGSVKAIDADEDKSQVNLLA